jgi:hypothetical protein
MPHATKAEYLREKATNFRRLAEGHGNAGNRPISDKLNEVAADFEAQAAKLMIAAAFEDLRRVTDLEALAAAAAAARLAASASDQRKT